MNNLRQAAQQALEALEQQRVFSIRPDHEGKEVTPAKVTNAITALRAALNLPEQEPVAWMWKDGTVTADPDRADGTWTPLYTAPTPRKPLTVPDGYALISIAVLKAWGKYDEVLAACQYGIKE